VALELVDAPAEAGYRFVVAEAAGEVAGYACFGATPLTKGTWDLYWIAVDPARQGEGVGRALLVAAEDAIRAEDGRMLLIETAGKASYEKTRAMYLACGYREIARVPDFYDVGDDKVVYGRTWG
jgi:ribosomal protein S18 acetylase RimI-like enzyme